MTTQHEVISAPRRYSRYLPSMSSISEYSRTNSGQTPSADDVTLAPIASGKYLDWGSFDLQKSPPYWMVKHSKSSTNLAKAKQIIKERGSEDLLPPDDLYNDEFNDDLEFLADDEMELPLNKSCANSHSESTPYCLVYKVLRGEAELIRLMFIAAGANFEERKTHDDEELTNFLALTPYRALPVLTKGKDIWGCPEAIVRTLARKYNLMGVTNHEHLVVEAMFERLCQLKRAHSVVVSYLHIEVKGKERMEWLYHQLRYVILPPALAEWEKLILSSKGPFLVTSGMSLADLAIMDFLDQCSLKIPLDDVVTDFEAVMDLLMLVKGSHRIATYLDERPDLEWNL